MIGSPIQCIYIVFTHRTFSLSTDFPQKRPGKCTQLRKSWKGRKSRAKRHRAQTAVNWVNWLNKLIEKNALEPPKFGIVAPCLDWQPKSLYTSGKAPLVLIAPHPACRLSQLLDTSCRSRGMRSTLGRCKRSDEAQSPLPFSPPSLPIVFIISIRGRNMAMTMLPTTMARKTIMIGSSSEVMAATALSTSSS